jgi:pSer/pThr/pTyr-binding forkhead associated (FHA) protein
MSAPLTPMPDCVLIHLLDSAQGDPLQTWRFSARHEISIGRNEENDIVIAHPQVSRYHARLVANGTEWTLFSTGRHGTLVNDRAVTEYAMSHSAIFQLGSGGPKLRFDNASIAASRSETMDNIDWDSLAALHVDDVRKQQEVEQITGNAVFQALQEHSRSLRRSADSNGMPLSDETAIEPPATNGTDSSP